MTDTSKEITRHLSVLAGLDVTSVHHAADMLTLQFGALTPYVSRSGVQKLMGAWTLHIQCSWQIERNGNVCATHTDLLGSKSQADSATQRISNVLVTFGAATVENVLASESGGLSISLSRGLRIVITPNGVADEEDWRFFSPASSEDHFVIEGGTIAT
jgi:hypothetical protein